MANYRSFLLLGTAEQKNKVVKNGIRYTQMKIYKRLIAYIGSNRYKIGTVCVLTAIHQD